MNPAKRISSSPSGNGRGRGESVGRIAAETDRDRHPFVSFVITFPMARADLVHLPMHASRSVIVDLHPVHADIARPRFRIARVHIRQRHEAPAVFRPAFQDRQIRASENCRGPVFRFPVSKKMDDFLARSLPRVLRPRVQQIESLFEQAPAFAQIGGRFRLQDQLNFLGEVFDAFDLQAPSPSDGANPSC